MSESEIHQIIKRLDKQDIVLAGIKADLEPISKAYTTFTTLGKWSKGFLLLVSIVIGIVIGLLKLFKKTV